MGFFKCNGGCAFYRKYLIYYLRQNNYFLPWGAPNGLGIDDHIRGLCNRLPNCSSDEEAVLMASELRDALHQHIVTLRTQIKFSRSHVRSDDNESPPSDETGAKRYDRN
jgi:hypothetical protein